MRPHTRNLGYFFLREEMLLNEPRTKVVKIFNDLIVMATSHRYDRMGTLYLAEGPVFEAIDEGAMAPEYDVTFDANYNVTFTKREIQPYGYQNTI